MRDELRVEEDGKSEGHPVVGWIEVASQKEATSPHAKAGRLPSEVFPHEKV
jgi:hypothetical protein